MSRRKNTRTRFCAVVGDQQPGEGCDLRLLHGVADRRRARPTDRSARRARDSAFAAPSSRPRSACARRASRATGAIFSSLPSRPCFVRLQLAGDGGLHGGAHMALLRHRIDQAERLGARGRARSCRSASWSSPVTGLIRRGQPHRAAEARDAARAALRESRSSRRRWRCDDRRRAPLRARRRGNSRG